MELHARRRQHAMTRCPVFAALLLVLFSMLLLFLASVPSGGLVGAFPGLQLRAAAARFVPPRRLPLAVQGVVTKPAALRGFDDAADEDDDQQAVLLPDWEVLVLVRRPGGGGGTADINATCEFEGVVGASSSSPARAVGRLPSSGRHAYVCVMPRSARRRQPFRAPRVVLSAASSSDVTPVPAARGGGGSHREPPEMLRWRGRLAYESVVIDGGDVLVFANGVNPRQGVNRPAADVRCVYYRGADAAADVVASLPASTSAQQVFRCPPPPPSTPSSQEIRVTLTVTGEDPIPSLAVYSSPATTTMTTPPEKKQICACTMVRDVAKYLREWVVYHAAVGVDRFYIYDNGSEDDLAGQVRQLSSAGYDISTVAWPWTKAQEAGFSHSAAVHRDSCEWMAFIDVDEYIFSSMVGRTKSKKPAQSMLRSLVWLVEPDVGQVMLGCADFGPSGQTAHPKEGVTQGYTCRRRSEERHKSLVRLDAVGQSLLNSIHHFVLRSGFRGERIKQARVNHYKYQAWEEFKVKFRRRVSTYVADWTNPVNLQSKDRTPGLGFEAVEPEGWRHKFCEVDDTMLRDVTRGWFGVGFSEQNLKLAKYRRQLIK